MLELVKGYHNGTELTETVLSISVCINSVCIKWTPLYLGRLFSPSNSFVCVVMIINGRKLLKDCCCCTYIRHILTCLIHFSS